MYCPKCGHQQTADEMRFCSRCGFQLSGVTELLANDGAAHQPSPELPVRASRLSRRGAKILFLSVVIFPVVLFISYLFDSPNPLFLPAFLFLSGLGQIGYKYLFGEDLIPEGRMNALRGRRKSGSYLPPASPVPAQSFLNRETNDLVPPPSVTDRTTKLFERDA